MVVDLLSTSVLWCLGRTVRLIAFALLVCGVFFARHVFLVLVLLQRICDRFVVVVGASAPIAADVFVMWVEGVAFGGAVVGQGLLVVVGVFRLLELIWLMGVLMLVLRLLVVVSFLELLLVVGCPGILCL